MAAEEQAKWALGQVGIGIAGLFGLVITIIVAALAWREAQKSADAAHRTLVAQQRPRLTVRELLLIDLAPVQLRYVISNTGAGEAVIVESHAEIQMIDDGAIDPLQPIEGANPVGNVTIPTGSHIFREQSSQIGSFRLMLTAYEMNGNKWYSDLKPDPMLLFRGFVVYADKGGIRRRTAFLRSYDWKANRFRAMDDPDYEYAD